METFGRSLGDGALGRWLPWQQLGLPRRNDFELQNDTMSGTW